MYRACRRGARACMVCADGVRRDERARVDVCDVVSWVHSGVYATVRRCATACSSARVCVSWAHRRVQGPCVSVYRLRIGDARACHRACTDVMHGCTNVYAVVCAT